jgi:hypothetical protein
LKHDFIYPEPTITKLKIMFPHDTELAQTLESNSPHAWDMVMEKFNELGKCHYELSMAGFPVYKD